MKSNIRSKYIKDILADQESLRNQLAEQTTETIKDFLGESVKESLRQLISEAEEEDSYEEEEVDAPDTSVADDSQTEDSAETADADVADAETEDGDDAAASEDDSIDLDDETDSADGEVAELDVEVNDSEGDDVWSEMEQYKDENGEYDLTGMDNDSVIRVLKVMNPETDGVRVVKNDDGKLDVTVPASDEDIEFIIDVDGSDNNEFESEEMISEANTGYTDNYQNKTAMTTLPNKEVADKKNTYSMDGGVPEGDSKPWVGNAGDMSPYSQKVNESENIFEIELEGGDEEMVDEGATTVAQQGPNHRGMTKNHNNTNDKPARGRLTSQGGEMADGMAAYNENMNRKMDAILAENAELKKIIGVLKTRINENIQVNYALGRFAKLVTENTTSRQEKIDIIKRFDKAKNINEAKALYESIDRELKSSHSSADKGNAGVMQLAESKTKGAMETSMYKSDDLSETVSLMKRMDSLGRK